MAESMMDFNDKIRFEAVKKATETKFKFRELRNISRVDSISPPSVFIGSKLRYPNVNVGILSPLQSDKEAWVYDAPKFWAGNNFQVGDVVKLRDGLLNSRFKSKVTDIRLNKKFVEIAKEIAIASKPVDVEIELKRKLNFSNKKDRVVLHQGLNAPLKKARITSNVKIPRKVDKVMNDELKASEGMKMLYKSKINEYSLSKILSVGVLGLKKNKKLVPTRWSITATDDILGKDLIREIKDYKSIEDYELFFGEFLGNQYIILFFPGVWSFELFEFYLPNSSWNPSQEIKASTDHEFYNGRKEYAFNTAGGYYATRLPVLEYLKKQKRQASILALRIETPSYWAALGVWVVRESVRKALENRKMKFNTMEEIKEAARKISKIKYNFDNAQILKKSKLLLQLKTQKSLRDWF